MAYAGQTALLAALLLTGCGFLGTADSGETSAVDHFIAADLLADEGRTDEALAELDLAVQADPDMAVAHAAIGKIHCSREQYAPAAAAYAEAVRANPFDLDLREQWATCCDRLGQTHKAERIRSGSDAAEPVQ